MITKINFNDLASDSIIRESSTAFSFEYAESASIHHALSKDENEVMELNCMMHAQC